MQSGQKVYFRMESGTRLLKGELVEQSGENWIVKGTRTATKNTRPIVTVPTSMIVTDHIAPKDRIKKTERNGVSLSIPAAESIRRKQISFERLEMTECQVLQARAMLEMRRRAVRGLASVNRITTSDADMEELSSEYVVAQLMALRATAATATDDDIREFKKYLSGEATECRMMMTITRTSRTAAIRYLKRRAEYQHMHVDIADYQYRLAA